MVSFTLLRMNGLPDVFFAGVLIGITVDDTHVVSLFVTSLIVYRQQKRVGTEVPTQ
jgi:hypothetical protein